MTDVVTIHHCRKSGFCVDGVRRHCTLLGIDFRRLVKAGIPIPEIEHLEDAIVQRCIATARAEESEDGR